MSIQKYELFSAPGSADIPETFIGSIQHNEARIGQHYIASYARSHFGNRGNEGSLLIDKITELLHKEFGQMTLSVSIRPPELQDCYEIRVRYGSGVVGGDIHINTSRRNFRDVQDGYGLQMAAEVTAEQLIRHIRDDIAGTMFGRVEAETPNEKVKKEETFRKILI